MPNFIEIGGGSRKFSKQLVDLTRNDPHARHFIGMRDQLENVQRYFTRRVHSYRCKLECKHDYPDRLVHLQLESLELRRLYNDIKMVYKIVHKLTSLNGDVLLSYHNANYNYYHVLTRGHTLKLKKNAFRLDVAINHFCNRVVSVWNGLPEHVVLLLHLHCSRNIYAPSLIGICKYYTCIIYQYPTLCGI